MSESHNHHYVPEFINGGLLRMAVTKSGYIERQASLDDITQRKLE